jgi:hypothetical protein
MKWIMIHIFYNQGGNMKKSLIFFIVFIFSLSIVWVRAEDPKVNEADMMKKWLAFATPGAEHQAMTAHVGEWEAVNTMWMSATAPAQTSKGTAIGEMILGGRYLKISFKSVMMGQPFEGISITGYDNFKKKYLTLWIDTMGTGFFIAEGQVDNNSKIMTELAEMDDVITGKKIKYRTTYFFDTPDSYTQTMYQTNPGEKEFKSMEVKYTRKK